MIQYSAICNQIYPFTLSKLQYDINDFVPYLTSESFDYHYGKHHATYVTNLNNLLASAAVNNISLEKLILQTDHNSSVFRNAAQIWNHNFFWHSISPVNSNVNAILNHINKDFNNYEQFVTQFTNMATTHFGSGWIWIVWHENKLKIITTHDAYNPMIDNMYPILTCDLWEHAYYIDYRNKRAEYIENYIKYLINWDFALHNLHQAQKLY